ncbi:hypothetical protein [Tunturibacter empetritectus]|uniref:Uncharacterized protein n=1 Tax=Tunturiibacter empetritectus TaxID=3069691 RepID=A0A7W8IGE7_9BACT|nr:hypothetical protein [Edaphobacter lichenicola]MBB5316697.1 hypothetical protein [Edaphobacter lichenicola]
MPFPELTNRLLRLFNIKDSSEAATSIPLDRPLTLEEQSLIEWLLLHGEPSASEFLPQLEAAHVYCGCSCGCPTINIEVPVSIPAAHAQSNILADFVAGTDENPVGVILFQAGGRLSGLEVYAFGDPPIPFGLPDPTTVRLFEKK